MHDEPGSAGSATPADDQAEVLATGQPGGRGEHGASGSGREAGAALAPAGGQNRAARASPHPQPEPMGLGATTVVGLEGALTLAHFWVSRCSLQAGLVVSPAALTRSPHYYTAAPDENRGCRVMFRHSLARARKDARYQRETIREYAAARRFSNRLRCALDRHTIRRQTGHGWGVTGRFGLWRLPRLVSVLPPRFRPRDRPEAPHTWRRTSARNPDPPLADPVRGADVSRRTFVHSCGQPVDYVSRRSERHRPQHHRT